MANYCMKCGKPIEQCTCGNQSSYYSTQNPYAPGASNAQPQSGAGAYMPPNRRSQSAAQPQPQQPQQSVPYYSAPQQNTGWYQPQQAGPAQGYPGTNILQSIVNPPKYSFTGIIGNSVLSDGEVNVRSYMIGKYPFNAGNATLYITNKRVILKESYNWLFLRHYKLSDINIENVHGFTCEYGRHLSTFGAGLALFIFILSMITMNSDNQVVLGLVLLLLSLVVLIIAMRSTHSEITIIGTDEHSPVKFSQDLGGLFHLLVPKLGVMKPRPTQDMDTMAVEIGACLYDLRTYGDTAVKRWKQDEK